MLGGKGKGGRVGQRESPSGTEVSPCLRVANLQKIFFYYLDSGSGVTSFTPYVHGRGYKRYSPFGLPPANTLLSVSEFGSKSEHLQHAQCRYSSILHHSAWERVRNRWAVVSVRDALRFMAASQPCAGAFLNAVPSHTMFRMTTPSLRICVQRRLGLPLSAYAGLVAGPGGGLVDRGGRRYMTSSAMWRRTQATKDTSPAARRSWIRSLLWPRMWLALW
jgi:hypothetical protein